MTDANGQEPTREERVRAAGDPFIAQGYTPRQVGSFVYCMTGIGSGAGGHSDPCASPVCPYCGACGPDGGCGGNCPNLGRRPEERYPWADPAYDQQALIADAARKRSPG